MIKVGVGTAMIATETVPAPLPDPHVGATQHQLTATLPTPWRPGRCELSQYGQQGGLVHEQGDRRPSAEHGCVPVAEQGHRYIVGNHSRLADPVQGKAGSS